MRWAVIGSTGLLGQDLLTFLKERGEDAHGFNRTNFQLSDEPQKMAKQLGGFDVWVNCVGYTLVDKAEADVYAVNLVNGIYAGALAQAAKMAGARFIHISTDYVFDGFSSSPYKVDELVNPQTAYGTAKALGEQLVSESGADYSILRTAWLYGAADRCFPKVMAELLKKNGNVRVVSDQFGQPTWTRDLAEMVLQVVQLETMPRIVHAVSSGQATWADFAKEVALSIGLSEDSIEEISSSEFPTPAKRPAWSVLNNSSVVLEPIGDWRERWREAAPKVLRGI
jgi:dTDP-4-dehydrorhamnose reductase